MIAKRAAEPRVIVQPAGREEAQIGVDREQSDGRMALADGEAVTVGPVRIALPERHHIVIERRKDLGRRENRGIVPRLRDIDQADRFEPDELRPVPEPVKPRRMRDS